MAPRSVKPGLRQIAVTTALGMEEVIVPLLERLFETTPSTMILNDATEAVTSVYVPEDRRTATDLKRELRQELGQLADCGIDLGPTRLSVRKLRPQDWSESWKRHFRPLAVSNRLLIKPPWSRRKGRPGQATVILDPGMSFGTGNHPTTFFCLEALANEAPESGAAPRSCLDIGTGSGILAIAAAKLGYQPVVAFDNDPDAVSATQENAQQNGVAEALDISKSTVETLPLRRPQQYDLVLANLTHDLLKAHSKRIVAAVQPGGLLCLAGILTEQFAAVTACFKNLGLTPEQATTLGEWRSGSFRR